MLEWTLNRLLDETSSASPTPGGGSVSGICVALGIDLICMAISITRKKHNHQSLQKYHQVMKEKERQVRELFLEDAENFAAFMTIYKMPRDTRQEKADRQKRLEVLAGRACYIPLTIAEISADIVRWSYEVHNLVNKDIQSDVRAGRLIVQAGGQAGLESIEENLRFVSTQQRHVIHERVGAVKEKLTVG